MKYLFRLVPILVFAAFAAPLSMEAQQAPSASMSTTATAGRELPKPNYDLAFRWTSTKVGKYASPRFRKSANRIPSNSPT